MLTRSLSDSPVSDRRGHAQTKREHHPCCCERRRDFQRESRFRLAVVEFRAIIGLGRLDDRCHGSPHSPRNLSGKCAVITPVEILRSKFKLTMINLQTQ